MPPLETHRRTDPHRLRACRRSARLRLASVERIRDDSARRRTQGKVGQAGRIARQDRSEGAMHGNVRIRQCAHRLDATLDRLATGLVQPTDIVIVRGQREAHPQSGVLGERSEQADITQDQRSPGLQHKNRWRVIAKRFEDGRHRLFELLRWLIRIHQRRAIDDLRGAQLATKQSRRIVLERRMVPPSSPIVRPEAPVDLQGRHIAIGATIKTVASRVQRMREPGSGDEAGGRAQNRADSRAVDRERVSAKFELDRPSHHVRSQTRCQPTAPLQIRAK